MKILLLINWKITYCDEIPKNLQPSDYCCSNETFWFFKYFKSKPEVKVVDIQAPKMIEKIENKIRFHFYQTFRVLKDINNYDLIFIHGSTSAMVLCALKRIFKFKTPPIYVVDISSFHQAHENGLMTKLAQFASKEFDYMFYHTSSQIEYYKKCFPWLVNKSKFVPLGVDYEYWNSKKYPDLPNKGKYIICVGYRKRDWNTLIEAYTKSNVKEELYLIGNPEIRVDNPKIKVLPFIPIDKLNTYIVNAKYSVIPLDDFNYSFGQLTLLQQMALGVPIIAADVPALRDYISKSKGCIKYKPYDIQNLKNCLLKMDQYTQNQLILMGQKNNELIKYKFNEKTMGYEFEILNGVRNEKVKF